MLDPRSCAPLRRAIPVSFGLVAVLGGGVVPAQGQHPFEAPRSMPTYSLSGRVGLLDANRDGSLDVVTQGLFFGVMLTTLDEVGEALATNVLGPTLTPPSSSYGFGVPIALAGGAIDGDANEDLVTVSSSGSVHLHRNLGATRIDAANFAPDVVVDDLSGLLPANPPFALCSFPALEVVDLDGDGLNDVLAGGGVADNWSAVAGPGVVACYLGDGNGGFVPVRHPVAGSVIDAEWADVDGDGDPDHVVALVELGSLGAYTYEILHLQLQGQALVPAGPAQLVGPGRCTALEVADVTGDGLPDYVLAQLLAQGASPQSAVYYYSGDGAGNIDPTAWGVMTLPPGAGVGDYIPSLQVEDFDRDGEVDIAMLRGSLVNLAAFATNATAGDAEVLVAMGPAAVMAQPAAIPLAGSFEYSSTDGVHFAMLPLMAQPDFLQPVDLGRDRSVDLLVTGLRSLGTYLQPAAVTLRNGTLPMPGDPRFERVGAPSGGAPQRPARIGFEGGPAQVGNASFACTIQNVRGGCLVGLMWSVWGAPDMVAVHGFTLHLAPTEFGYVALASGTQAGEGFYSYPLPIPNDPALIGDAGYFQYNYYDHVVGALGGTQATGVSIGG